VQIIDAAGQEVYSGCDQVTSSAQVRLHRVKIHCVTIETVSTFYVENFGCRAAQADGAAIERQFADRGLDRASSPSIANVVVLNTCTVTAAADQDARAAIRRIHRQNPGCQIIVTGCYAQRAPEEIAALPGVVQVIGNSHKHRLAELTFSSLQRRTTFVPLFALTENRELETDAWRRPVAPNIYVSDIFAHTELLAAPVFDAANERTRPNLKVQDGCDNRCSFCIIPSVRGRSRSLPREEVLREVNALVAAGYREVVVSGINLGRWGRDLLPKATAPDDPDRFEALVHTILDRTDLEKLRISSVEPMDWSDEFIALMAKSPRIAKHAHVPLQSGSDTVLRRMHRRYRPWHYREKIEKIRAAMPTAAIGADVMVGFPGETDAEFTETRRMIEELAFTYLHVFTYSARPGTPAATMPNQVSAQVARERNRILRDLADQKKRAFMQSFLGKTVEAITLNSTSRASNHADWVESCGPSFTEALTDNYLKLYLHGLHAPNRWLRVRIEEVQSGALVGSVRQSSP
jgi:threonylcarbamoyladenosine tRNA methylthiotransferase MtaB